MAITEPIANPAVTEIRRTARASIEVPRTGPGEFVVYREKLHLDADDNVVLAEASQAAVRRGFAAIAEETVEVDNGRIGTITLTGEQVIAALSALFDRWADEDAAQAAQPVMLAPPPPPPPYRIPLF